MFDWKMREEKGVDWVFVVGLWGGIEGWSGNKGYGSY